MSLLSQDGAMDVGRIARRIAGRTASPVAGDMRTNPKALFTVSTLAREDIAGLLNDAADLDLAPDDDRLTDEVCTAFAAAMHESSDEEMSPGQEDHLRTLVEERILPLLGAPRTAP